ncbi:MAG: helix-turn-helix domain-containing protein [Candidatus Pacearchaeota archaeon]
METRIFEKLGLVKSEIEIYFMLLRIGESTATKISEKTRLNRSHIYDSLKKLIDKGLVSTYEKNKVQYFVASSPEVIQDYVKDLENEVVDVILELNKLKRAEKLKTKIQLFQGKNGLKTVLQDILRTKKDYVVFGEEGQFENIFPIYIQQFLRDVRKLGVKEKILSREGSRKKIMRNKNTQIKYLEDKFFSPATTVVYGNKVAIFIWSEPYNVTLIEDKEVADSYRNYFGSLWLSGKK